MAIWDLKNNALSTGKSKMKNMNQIIATMGG